MDSMDYMCEWCPENSEGMQMDKVLAYRCTLADDTTKEQCDTKKINNEAFEYDEATSKCTLESETNMETECTGLQGTLEELTCASALDSYETMIEMNQSTCEQQTELGVTIVQAFQLFGCCGEITPVPTCEFCNANGIEKKDHVFMKMCDIEIDEVLEANMTCSDLDALKGHAWGADTDDGEETPEACIIEVLTKDEAADNVLTEADCTGYTMEGVVNATMKYEEMKCEEFELGYMDEDIDTCDAVVMEFGLNMSYVDYPMELGCCLPTDTTAPPVPQCLACANDWAVADKCDGDERLAGDCAECGDQLPVRCPMNGTTICETQCGDSAAEVGDACWLASATACAEGTFSAAGCAKCDWTKDAVSEECYTAMVEEAVMLCDKPQKVKQGMRFDGLTATNFDDTKPALLNTLADLTNVDKEDIGITYTGPARRMLNDDADTANNVEVEYTVPEADAAALTATLGGDTFVASVNSGLVDEGVTVVTAASVSAATTEAVTTTMPPTQSPTDPPVDPDTPEETTQEPEASAGALSVVAAFVTVLFM